MEKNYEVGTEYDRGYLAAVDNSADTLMKAHMDLIDAKEAKRKLRMRCFALQQEAARLRKMLVILWLTVAMLIVYAIAPAVRGWLPW